MPKAEKLETVALYKKLFEDAGSVFVTDYQGLNVSDLTDLRKKLRENNVKFLVGKNTLFRLAAKDSFEGIDQHLSGPTAVVFTEDDPAGAAKILNDSFKSHDLPKMKAFWLDGVPFDGAEIKRLADLPTKDQLYSQVAAAVESPLTELVRSLDAFHQELIGSIDALAEKKQGEG
ncbi:MAG: 50S ribosomal protein L10 [candidate division Zixibacteria bacterium]|nr:50S ribosomal protein L10 [candidate division Zixibacteria bacterium]MDH3939273.1 50S ribosomal protein L10 [candidate division Zixibacteria bacterium]MDH4035362.1 50S ribosomal protein L10 [candidate division Zixibacteria bacterium]